MLWMSLSESCNRRQKIQPLWRSFAYSQCSHQAHERLNYGKDYRYDHDFENKYSYQKYFPDQMNETVYYEPGIWI
jgi:hypothetical protein